MKTHVSLNLTQRRRGAENNMPCFLSASPRLCVRFFFSGIFRAEAQRRDVMFFLFCFFLCASVSLW